MQLYKRKGNPNYYVTWYEKGKRFRRSTGTSQRDKAEALAAKWRNDIFLAKHYCKKPPIPFSKCLLNYAKIQKRDHPTSFKSSTYYRLKTLASHFNEMVANDIDMAAIRTFMNERMETIKPASVYKELSTLRAILNKAINDGLLDTKPLFPKFKKLHGNTRWLTIDEECRLCASASQKAPHLVPLIQLGCDTGGRRGELLRLDWGHVDLENRRLVFFQTKNGEDRTVRLCDRALRTLNNLGPKSEGPVFTYNHKPIKTVTTSFNTACKTAGLHNVTFHSLRHTFASRLAQGGTPLYDIMQMMGHKSLDMVQRYAHLAPDYQDGAIAVLNRVGHKKGTETRSLQNAVK